MARTSPSRVFSRQDYEELALHRGFPCVSLFMATQKIAVEEEKDKLILRNLLDQAQEALVASGMRTPDAVDLLAPAAELLPGVNAPFWQHQDRGLAIFVSKELFRLFHLAFGPPAAFRVNDRFYLKPFLPVLGADARFSLLCLYYEAVRLYEGTFYGLSEVDVSGLTRGMAEALSHDEIQRRLRIEERRAPEVGQGREGPVEVDRTEDWVYAYFREIDQNLRDLLVAEGTTLVVTGSQFLLPIYMKVNTYPRVINGGHVGAFEVPTPDALHAQVLPLLRRGFEEGLADVRARYGNAAGTGKASNDIGRIVSGAYQGRVDVLFAEPDYSLCGTFDQATNEVKIGNGGADDLVDLAAVFTFLKRGNIYAVGRDRLPGNEPVAALFRY